MKDMFKKILIPGSIFVSVLFVCIVYGSLNYSGFCFQKMGYLSDDEKIRMAISAINKEGYFGDYEEASYYTSGGINRIHIKIVPYESVEAFLQQNPNCCTLIPRNEGYVGDKQEERPPTFWESVSGRYNYIVRIEYLKKYIEDPLDEKRKEGPGQELAKQSVQFYNAGNCGEKCVSCFKGW